MNDTSNSRAMKLLAMASHPGTTDAVERQDDTSANDRCTKCTRPAFDLDPSRCHDPLIAFHGALTENWQTIGSNYQSALLAGRAAKSQQAIYKQLLKLATLGLIGQCNEYSAKAWRLKP